MGRILFFLLLAIVVYLAWRAMQRRGSNRGSTSREPPRPPQAMVSCATCGLHLPRQDALATGDRYFCCEEHRQRPPAA